jgi:hypothetical protein
MHQPGGDFFFVRLLVSIWRSDLRCLKKCLFFVSEFLISKIDQRIKQMLHVCIVKTNISDTLMSHLIDSNSTRL